MAFSINSSFAECMKQTMEEEKKVTKEAKVVKGAKGTKVSKGTKVDEGAKAVKGASGTNDASPKSSKKSTTTTTTEYEAEVKKEMLVKDNGKGYKEFLEVSVKRFGDEGLPYVHLSTRVESEVYNGYKKGKHISFPLEFLYDFLDLMNEVDEECDKKHIE